MPLPTSPLFGAIKELAVYLGKKLDIVARAVTDSKQNTAVIEKMISSHSRMMGEVTTRIEKALARIKDPKFSGDITIDTSEIKDVVKELKTVVAAIPTPDMTPIERGFKMLLDRVEDLNPEKTVKALGEVKDAIRGKEYIMPKTLKLDDAQFRALRVGGGSMPTYPGPMAARNVRTVNTAVTATNTQYSYTFPANTTAWSLKLRDQGTLAYYSFTTGTLPLVGGGGDGSNYVTIPQNFVQSRDGVDWSGKIIYFGAESASQVMELTVYTA